MLGDKLGGDLLAADQGLRPVGPLLDPRDGGGVQFLELLGVQLHDGVLLQQPVLLLEEDQLAPVEEGDVVADLLQVADDVGGQDHRVVGLAGEVVEHVQHLVPDHGVQAAGGLVQQQQFGPVGEGCGDGQLHLHPPGELLELLVLGQGEPGQVLLIEPLVPPGVGEGHELARLPGGDDLRQAGLVQHHPDVLLGLEKLRALVVHPQQGDLPLVPGNGVHEEFQGGGLARPVFPHQPQDAPGGEGKGEVIQGEPPVSFGEVAAFDGVHRASPFSVSWSRHSRRNRSSTSSSPRPQAAARERISWMCSSIWVR